MKFEREYLVGVEDIGINNQMTNYAFLSKMVELASTHADTAGFGVNDIPKKKKVWLLMSWKLQVLKRPIYGSVLRAKTWARKLTKEQFYTYRDFEIFCENEKVAIASSKWVLFDIEKNKISKLDEKNMAVYNPDTDNVFEEEEIPKLKEPIEKEFSLFYKIQRADIDVNQHVHNLNYLKIAYEALPEKEFFLGEKNNIEIMYKHQIVLGDEVNCYYTKKDDKSVITIKSKDDKILHSIIELG